jgi:hypothetical protein
LEVNKWTFNETHEKKLGKSENDKKYCKKKNFVQIDSVLPYGILGLKSNHSKSTPNHLRIFWDFDFDLKKINMGKSNQIQIKSIHLRIWISFETQNPIH